MNNESNSTQPMSDYGIFNGDACDPLLRSRVLSSLQNHQAPQLTTSQLLELTKYIGQLEDALLRYHWGAMEHHRIHEILKCSTGLDIEGRSSAIDAMAAADA